MILLDVETKTRDEEDVNAAVVVMIIINNTNRVCGAFNEEDDVATLDFFRIKYICGPQIKHQTAKEKEPKTTKNQNFTN